MKIKGLKKNNHGMTLVELLVAIAIFAAAIVPLLYAFVYSTGYNFRSQSTMQSTGIAQAVIEKCKGSNVDIDDVMKMLGDGSIFDNTQFEYSSTPPGGAVTSVTYEGVHSLNYDANDARVDSNIDSRRQYKVNIEVSPAVENLRDYSSVQAISTQTAIFDLADANMVKSEDLMAETKLIELIEDELDVALLRINGVVSATHDADEYFDASDISTKREDLTIDRFFTIDISDTGVTVGIDYYIDDLSLGLGPKTANVDGASKTVEATVVLTGYDRAGGTPFYSVNMDSYGHTGGSIYSGLGSALYFYYFPGYDLGGAYDNKINYLDYFDITNTMTNSVEPVAADGSALPAIERFDIYLYKQYDKTLASTVSYPFENADSSYKPYISLDGTDPASVDTYLFHNIRYTMTRDGKVSIYTMADLGTNINCNPGANCYDCSKTDASFDYTNYGSTYCDVSSGDSPLLTDYAALPGRHDPVNGGLGMYPTRYHIKVTVYLMGHSDPVETMEGDFLNW